MEKMAAPKAERDVFQTAEGAGTASTAMSANIMWGWRCFLPEGEMLVTHLGYMCITVASSGNVELLILRPTVPGGLIVDLIATTGMVPAVGSGAHQSLALTAAARFRNGDILGINPDQAHTIRTVSSYSTLGALKSRGVLLSSAPNPWSGQRTLSTSLGAIPLITAHAQ